MVYVWNCAAHAIWQAVFQKNRNKHIIFFLLIELSISVAPTPIPPEHRRMRTWPNGRSCSHSERFDNLAIFQFCFIPCPERLLFDRFVCNATLPPIWTHLLFFPFIHSFIHAYHHRETLFSCALNFHLSQRLSLPPQGFCLSLQFDVMLPISIAHEIGNKKWVSLFSTRRQNSDLAMTLFCYLRKLMQLIISSFSLQNSIMYVFICSTSQMNSNLTSYQYISSRNGPVCPYTYTYIRRTYFCIQAIYFAARD